VGEFRRRSEATRQIAFVEKRFSWHFDDADGSAERAGRRYKAVFTGFSETEARNACRAMHARRLACEVLDPS